MLAVSSEGLYASCACGPVKACMLALSSEACLLAVSCESLYASCV